MPICQQQRWGFEDADRTRCGRRGKREEQFVRLQVGLLLCLLIFRQREKSRISRIRGRCIWQLLIRSDGPSASHLSCFRPRAYASTLYLANGPCPLATWLHEPTGNHLQGEPNCQPTEGSQPDGFCAGRQLATVTALSLGCLPGFVKPRWAVMRKRNG